MVSTSPAHDRPVSRAELLTALSDCVAEARAAQDALRASGAHHTMVTARVEGAPPFAVAIPTDTVIAVLQRRIEILGAPEAALAAALAPEPALYSPPAPGAWAVRVHDGAASMTVGPFGDWYRAAAWRERHRCGVLVNLATAPDADLISPEAAEARLRLLVPPLAPAEA